jgi:hypothetical protein
VDYFSLAAVTARQTPEARAPPSSR